MATMSKHTPGAIILPAMDKVGFVTSSAAATGTLRSFAATTQDPVCNINFTKMVNGMAETAINDKIQPVVSAQSGNR
uniref:Uncharacterized protein n=1 Tax=Romanomermis culicivorax TaxID=13658 RepID=A0A915KVI1_ROMCU